MLDFGSVCSAHCVWEKQLLLYKNKGSSSGAVGGWFFKTIDKKKKEEKKEEKKVPTPSRVLNPSWSRLGECQGLLVLRYEQGFHECGTGAVYLLLSAGSQKRGAHAGTSSLLNQTTEPCKDEEFLWGSQTKYFVQNC